MRGVKDNPLINASNDQCSKSFDISDAILFHLRVERVDRPTNLPTIIKNDNGGATLLILGTLGLLGIIFYLKTKRKKELDKEA